MDNIDKDINENNGYVQFNGSVDSFSLYRESLRTQRKLELKHLKVNYSSIKSWCQEKLVYFVSFYNDYFFGWE